MNNLIPFLVILDIIFFKTFCLFTLVLVVLGLCCCASFSLVLVSEGYSLVAVCWFLIVVASLVAEHRL